VQRYYWREINRLTFEKLAAWMDSKSLNLTLGEIRKSFPDVLTECKQDALEFWKTVHKRLPQYDTVEQDQESFLRGVAVPMSDLHAPYQLLSADNNHPLGRFRGRAGQLLSAERIAREHYEKQGWEVHDCERRLINALCAVLLSPVYQDPNDPRLFTGMRGSTDPHADRSSPAIVHVTLPDDFGTPLNYERRSGAYANRIASLSASSDLLREFDSLTEPGRGMREYLAVHDQELHLARSAIGVIPRATLCSMLDWVVRDFWRRRCGWPDLFVTRSEVYRFVEVKTRKDRLSQEQMVWLEWACGAGSVACELLRVLPEQH